MTCKFVGSTEPRVIAGRHQDPCACDDRQIGCLPCPELHCCICQRVHAKATCTRCVDAARSDVRRITVANSYAYIDMQIGYMSEQNDPPFDEFARDLRGCRAHLENVLQDGERPDRSQVPCVACETRLVKVFADREDGDHWRCPRCR